MLLEDLSYRSLLEELRFPRYTRAIPLSFPPAILSPDGLRLDRIAQPPRVGFKKFPSPASDVIFVHSDGHG